MRLNVASLRRMVKGKLHVEFVRQELTSYSGLELLRRYLRQLDLPSRLRAACALDGQIHAVRGTLAVGLACRRKSIPTILVPAGNRTEA